MGSIDREKKEDYSGSKIKSDWGDWNAEKDVVGLGVYVVAVGASDGPGQGDGRNVHIRAGIGNVYVF